MKVTHELVDRLAYLSRLEFNAEETARACKDLDRMLGFVDQLNAVNTVGVEPLIHMSNEVNVLRKDKVGKMLSQKEALHNAPKKDDYYFRVPKVLNKK